MKSYNHLFERFISDENIELAIKLAFQGKKKKRRSVQMVLSDLEHFKIHIRNVAYDYHNAEHVPKQIYDGISRKKRIILVPSITEQVIHHMVCNVLVPIIQPSMYEHSYASLPNRGATLGQWYILKAIRHDKKNCRYYFKMDVRKYFDSIPHDRLKEKLARIIRDKRFLDVLFTIIDVEEKGIPLGFYTSQWFANFYLSDFDHWVKEELGTRHYYRYMDDMVIFHSNKKELHEMHRRIEKRLHDVEGLEIKGNWQIVRFHYVKKDGKEIGRDLDFMGYRFFRDRTLIRKSILRKSRRKAMRIGRKKCPTIYECRQMLSYVGWYKRTDTYGYWKRWIAPYVSLGFLKRRISAFDRRNNECGMTASA